MLRKKIPRSSSLLSFCSAMQMKYRILNIYILHVLLCILYSTVQCKPNTKVSMWLKRSIISCDIADFPFTP